ncbi:MAG: NUDIX hydrolase [Micromonosporaceae bacterium]
MTGDELFRDDPPRDRATGGELSRDGDTHDGLPRDGLGREGLRRLLPADLPVVERSAVRLVVLDSDDRILLFFTNDIGNPDLGTWWELPGGGIDPGETYLQAAVRELREETGIVITPDQVGPASWRRSATYRYRRERRLQHEVVATARLSGPGPDIDESGRFEYEKLDYTDFRWWPVAEVIDSGERFYPGRLPALLPRLLAGDEIDEPFEHWS